MNLLIDIGNTAIKFAITDEKKEILLILTLSSRELIAEKNLRQKINMAFTKVNYNLHNIKLICLSSVRPMWDGIFQQLAIDLAVPFYQVKKNLDTRQLIVDIPNPRNIGADLLVGAYAMIELYPHQDAILINMGTATTISMIKDQKLVGTIIMPGLETSAEALFSRAQLLQTFEYSYEATYIGKNTKEAVNIGLVNGHLFAINSFIKNLSEHLSNPIILLTGGNIDYIKDVVDYKYDKNLLFKGLMAILQANNLI